MADPDKIDSLLNEMRFLNSDVFASAMKALRDDNRSNIDHLEKTMNVQFANLSENLKQLNTIIQQETAKREAAIKELWDAREKDRSDLAATRDALAEARGKMGVVTTAIAAGVGIIVSIVSNFLTGKN